jgi:hypothetical protein
MATMVAQAQRQGQGGHHGELRLLGQNPEAPVKFLPDGPHLSPVQGAVATAMRALRSGSLLASIRRKGEDISDSDPRQPARRLRPGHRFSIRRLAS